MIAIFLLGASVGSLVTMIRHRGELADIRAQLDRMQVQMVRKDKDKEAA